MRVTLWVLLYLLLGCSDVVAADSSWKLHQERQPVRVKYRKSPANLLQISASTTVHSGVGAFLYLLEDTATIRHWLANSHSAEVLAQPDQHTHLVHTRFKGVWPVSPRDMITRSVWSQQPDTGVLTILVSDIGQHYAVNAGYIRMQQVSGEWTLTPLPQGKLQITYQGQADPSGHLPHFLSNNVALKSTFQTFEKLSEVLANYQQKYPNIIE